MAPEIRSEQYLAPVEQPQIIENVANPTLLDRIRESEIGSKLAVMLAVGAFSVGVTETADAAKKKTKTSYVKNGYQDERDNLVTSVRKGDIELCQALNVSKKGTNIQSRFSYPYGSIESQRIKAKPGSKQISVVTKLRDVNLDSNEDVNLNVNPIEDKTEFMYGCSYVVDSVTQITIRARKGYVSEPQEIKYLEEPRAFHKDRFLTKTFLTKFILPEAFKKEDFKKKNYSVITTQRSSSIVRSWDPNAFEPVDPNIVNPPSPWSNKLIDPTQNVGVIAQNNANPLPRSKTFRKQIAKPRQVTLKPAKNSPWTKKPRYRN